MSSSKALGMESTDTKQSRRSNVSKSGGASSQVFQDMPKDDAGFVHRRHINSIALNTEAAFGTKLPTHNWSASRKHIAVIIGNGYFETFLGVLVTISFVVTIIETDRRAEDLDPPEWCTIAGIVLLVIYCMDVLARFYVLRMAFFQSLFNIIDILIVLADFIFLMLSSVFDELPSVMFLRVLRLMRLSRALNVVQSRVELYLMIEGLFGALRTLFYGGCLLAICFGMLGIITTEVIYPLMDDVQFADTCSRCPVAFASVKASMYTFLQTMVLGDEWGTHYLPVFEKYPWTAAIILPSFVTVHLGLLNLILAVIVDSATQARDRNTHEKAKLKELDKEANKEKLQDFCRAMDTDSSMTITVEELLHSFDTNAAFHATLHAMDIGREDLSAVFNILDNDDSGTVEYEEFVDQLYKMKSNDSHTMLVFIKHYVTDLRKKVGEDLVFVRQEIRDSICELHAKVSEEMGLIKEDIGLHLKSIEIYEQKSLGQQKEFKGLLQDEELLMQKELTILEETISLHKHSPKSENSRTVVAIGKPLMPNGVGSDGLNALLSKLSVDSEQMTSTLQDLAKRCETHMTRLVSLRDSFSQSSRCSPNAENGIAKSWTASNTQAGTIDQVNRSRAWPPPGCCSLNKANAPARVMA